MDLDKLVQKKKLYYITFYISCGHSAALSLKHSILETFKENDHKQQTDAVKTTMLSTTTKKGQGEMPDLSL